MSFYKKSILLLIILCGTIFKNYSNVIVTPANAGTCLNVSPGAYLPIGNIVIAEGAANDFSVQTNTTFILTAPTGFTFQFGVGTVAFTPSRNITAAAINVTLTTISITLSVTGTTLLDQITISGVNARATGNSLTGIILRKAPSGGTAIVAGDATGAGVVHGTLTSIGGLATYTTASAGNWTLPATWVGGIVPLCGDNVVINHSVTVNAAVTVTNATINAGGNLISTQPVTVNGTLTVGAAATYTHNNSTNVSTTIFKGTESLNPSSNLIINNWYDANVPLAQFISGNFGNVTMNYNAIWDQDGLFAPNKIKGTLSITNGQVVMDDGTGGSTSLTLQDVAISSLGSMIAAKGSNRNLAFTTNNFTDNSSSAALTALMYDTYGTLTWNCNGNLILSHDFSAIEGTVGIHSASATVSITGNFNVTAGKIDFTRNVSGTLNLTVTGGTSIISNLGHWCHFSDFNTVDITFTTTNLSITGSQIGNYLQGTSGMSTFNILNDFTYTGTGMFSFSNNILNFAAQIVNVGRDFTVTSGNVGLAFSSGVVFGNISRNFILTGASTMVVGQFNPLSTANTSISITRNCSLTAGEFDGAWNKGQLFFTTNGILSSTNAIFEGVYYPFGGNNGTATFTIDSLDFDGGEFYLFDSYITDGRTISANFGNLIDINFISANDKVFFIPNSTNNNNAALALTVTGNVVIGGLTTGTFISSRSAGNETCSIGGSVTINGGISSFVGSTAYSSQPHNITTTITGNLNANNGTLYLSALSGAATVTVTGNTTVSGGSLILKQNNGPAVMTINGAYSQSSGNVFVHNNTVLTNIADTIKVNGTFSQTGGSFTFDNATGSSGLATHVLVINGSSFTVGGTGVIKHANHLSANTVFGLVLYNRNGITTYNRSASTWDLQQVKQQIGNSTTINTSSSIHPFLISSHQDATATVHNTLTINGILQTGTTQIYARQQANYYAQFTVNAGGKLGTGNSGGLYSGSAAISCVYPLIAGINRMNYYLDANSTIEYNGIDNQLVTGIPNGIANSTQHKYGKLEINFLGTANTEFVFPESDSEVFVRTQLILTAGEFNLDNDHIKTSGGRSVNIENTATTLRTGGYLRSETEDASGILRWNITTNGSYNIPFGVTSTNYIPLTYQQSSGSTGWIKFATYGTSTANNLPYPPTVTHVNSVTGANNSSNTVDRFWYLNTSGNPTFSITFSATAGEFGSVVSARAQRWLASVKGWEPKKGTQSNPSATSTLVASTTGINSWWTLVSNSNPLPVELLAFTTLCENEKTVLNWTTASQENNDYFTIEKSYDAKKWTVLKKVKGEGTIRQLTNYEFVDEETSTKLAYYCLSQTDFNGTITQLKIAASKGCGNKMFEFVSTNFSNNALSILISITEPGIVEINILNSDGKTVAQKMQTAEAGLNTFILPCNALAKGMYLIRAAKNEQVTTKKIVKL